VRNLPTVVCCDLDSTLRHTQHRWGKTPRQDPSSSWEAYSLACSGDSVFLGTKQLLRLLWPHHQIHLVSSAHSSAKALTADWLLNNGIFYDRLVMADADECGLSSPEMKVAHIQEIRAQGLCPVLFMDDHPGVCEALEAVEVPTVCVNPRYPETPSVLGL
jgi:hypothetical protein